MDQASTAALAADWRFLCWVSWKCGSNCRCGLWGKPFRIKGNDGASVDLGQIAAISHNEQVDSDIQVVGLGGSCLSPSAMIIALLGDSIFSGALTDLLSVALKAANGLPVTDLVNILSTALGGVGLLDLLDEVKDGVAPDYLSNMLILRQKTTIYTQLTEYGFQADEATGNVIQGDDGAGADQGAGHAFISNIENEDGMSVDVPANGSAHSVGQVDNFRYTLSHGSKSDGATLSIAITGQTMAAEADQAEAIVTWGHVSDPEFFSSNDN